MRRLLLVVSVALLIPSLGCEDKQKLDPIDLYCSAKEACFPEEFTATYGDWYTCVDEFQYTAESFEDSIGSDCEKAYLRHLDCLAEQECSLLDSGSVCVEQGDAYLEACFGMRASLP